MSGPWFESGLVVLARQSANRPAGSIRSFLAMAPGSSWRAQPLIQDRWVWALGSTGFALRSRGNTARQQTCLRQQGLGLCEEVAREMRELEQVPWTFSYRFTCSDERYTSHELQIQDWEIGQSFRRWSRTDPDRWEEMIRQRYERELPERDLYLVVGNLAKRHQTFVLIGLVRPPRSKMVGGDGQQTLDLMGEQRPVADLGVGFEAEQADALGSDDEDEPFEERPAGQ
jgi:hypothetical protein